MICVSEAVEDEEWRGEGETAVVLVVVDLEAWSLSMGVVDWLAENAVVTGAKCLSKSGWSVWSNAGSCRRRLRRSGDTRDARLSGRRKSSWVVWLLLLLMLLMLLLVSN